MSVFKIKDEHPPITGLTISSKSKITSNHNHVTYFSLGEETDISQEAYPNTQIYIVNGGSGEFILDGRSVLAKEGDVIIVQGGTLCGSSTEDGFVYTEAIPSKEVEMNKIVKAGEAFKLAELLPYQKDSIVNADIVSNDTMKFVVMAFDEGTGLTPHAAPGNAIVFALEGKATIGYEGKDYPIEAGEQFHFAKGGMHSVTANGQFKMALLLVLE